MTATNELSKDAFELLLVSAIAESSTNPRKSYDAKALAELTASVTEKGVIVPIVVRPHPKAKSSITHELVAGSRRLRAATAAGFSNIPAIIRHYTDEQVLEVQIIENLQRADVHPLEEAVGYQLLLKQPNYTAEIIAQKIGHPPAYVYKRLALTGLIKEVRKSFLDNEINIGHALLIARLTDADQKNVFDDLLFLDEYGEIRTPITVAALDSEIKTQIFLDLSSAPWKKDDATLVTKAGACVVCTKRTGANAALFDELKKGDMCLDRACFGIKADAFLVQIVTKAEEAGKPLIRISANWSPDKELNAVGRSNYTLIDGKDEKKCDVMVPAIFVDGQQKGKLVKICQTKECKTHNPYYDANRGRDGGTGNRGEKESFWDVKAKKLEENIKTATRRAIVRDILESTFKIDKGPYASADWGCHFTHAQMQLFGLAMLSHSAPPELIEMLSPFQKSLQGKKLTSMQASDELEKLIRCPKGSPAADDLPRVITALALQEYVKEFEPYNDKARLELAGSAFGVDIKKVGIEVGTSMRASFKAKRAKSEAKKGGKAVPAVDIQKCRVCGCTDEDCSQCVEKTGEQCTWYEDDLCTACVEQVDATAVKTKPATNKAAAKKPSKAAPNKAKAKPTKKK